MVDYLTASACRGHRPKKIETLSFYPRNDLLAQLIKDRHLPRLLIAPTLFGKTAIAAEYAESIFSFEHVFWFDGKSPCFLRDLDGGAMSSMLIQISQNEDMSSESRLLVVDDLPYLNELRTEKITQLFESLLKLNWELIVTMTPSCDVFDTWCEETVRLHAVDLLLTENEIDLGRTKAERIERPASMFSVIERIPGAFWKKQFNSDELLHAALKEDLSDVQLLTFFVMLVLQEGSYEDIGVFIREKNIAMILNELKPYVYLEIDSCKEEFCAYSFPIKSIATAFMPHLDKFSEYSSFSAKGSLIVRLADALLGKDESERACALVGAMGHFSQRSVWLANRAEHLLDRACLFPAHELYDGLNLGKSTYRGKLLLSEAWRLFYLGYPEKTSKMIAGASRLKGLSIELRASLGLLILRIDDSSQRAFAYSILDDITGHTAHPSAWIPDIELLSSLNQENQSWKIPALLEFVLRDNPSDYVVFLENCLSCDTPDLIMTEMFIRVATRISDDMRKDEFDRVAFGGVSVFIHLACAHLAHCKKTSGLSFFETLLVIELGTLNKLYPTKEFSLLDPALREFARSKESSLIMQQNAFQRSVSVTEERQEEYRRTHPDELRKSTSINQVRTKTDAPPLSVRLFGGLVVSIGDEEVDPSFFSRQTVKTLLSFLVINQGKEISRDRLSEILWPESSPTAASRNLHSVWSLLRKALKAPSGSCPYLIRTQFSYKIESAYLSSDVAEFNDLCRKLLFGHPHVAEWTFILTRLTDIYGGDLLPTELKNEAILKARDDYRSRLVDACSMAALRLFEIKEYSLALWFAQTAVSHDLTREDAYALLMRAQIALGQRTAALDTYFRCQRYLSEELGIDPCARTRCLYQEIISEEVPDSEYVL